MKYCIYALVTAFNISCIGAGKEITIREIVVVPATATTPEYVVHFFMPQTYNARLEDKYNYFYHHMQNAQPSLHNITIEHLFLRMSKTETSLQVKGSDSNNEPVVLQFDIPL